MQSVSAESLTARAREKGSYRDHAQSSADAQHGTAGNGEIRTIRKDSGERFCDPFDLETADVQPLPHVNAAIDQFKREGSNLSALLDAVAKDKSAEIVGICAYSHCRKPVERQHAVLANGRVFCEGCEP